MNPHNSLLELRGGAVCLHPVSDMTNGSQRPLGLRNIGIDYFEDMRLDVFTIISLSIIPRTLPLPLNREPTLSRRLDASTCEFYGYVDSSGVYNEYTIEMAG
ncbi:hypothetical protein HD806DRAFT_528522 [Xylariaceae sp. AK1471]|nr:hypothetical protein HD806DRAFT_528522 [Xylariaceae sp. AK1471]